MEEMDLGHWQLVEQEDAPQLVEREDTPPLHEEMLQAEVQDDIPERLQLELRRILFKRKVVVTQGVVQTYIVSLAETQAAIQSLLRRRRMYMEAHGLQDPPHGGAAQPALHVFTDQDRAGLMEEWKQEYHARPDQIALQLRDSWAPMQQRKGKGNGKGKIQAPSLDAGLGPNKAAVRKGKHSRFALHLQRVAGSKTLAELILYTGRYDAEYLERVTSGGPRPAETVGEQAHDLALRVVAITGQSRRLNSGAYGRKR